MTAAGKYGLLWCICCVVTAACALSLSGTAPSDRSREKARYYFVEGQRREAEGQRDAALHLYKKAYDTDPSYAEASYRYGRLRLQIPVDTFQSMTEIHRSFGLLRPYVDAYPGDGEESIYYGYVAAQLDSLGEAERVFNRTFDTDPSQTTALLYLSEAYAGHEEFLKAADALSRYEKTEGKNPNVSLRKMGYYVASGDTTAAVREADVLIATNPRDPSFQVMKGNLYDALQMPDSAVVYYLAAERLDPDAGAPKLALADHYRQRGDSVAYDNKIYELLLSEDFGFDEKADLLAQYLQIIIYDKNDTSRGDYLFSVLSEQYPHEPRLLDLAARYSSAQGDFRKAEEQISYALDMQPDNKTMWGQLMTYQAGDNRPAEALKTYERAKRHVDPDTDLKTLYGMLAVQAEDYPAATGMFRSLIAEIDSTLRTDTLISLSDLRKDISLSDLDRLSSLYATLGDVLHQAGDKTDAYVSYENAVLLNPDNAMAYNNHAYFLTIDGGDLTKAEALVRQALKGRDADNPTYLDTLAWILHLKGDGEGAEETQRRAVELLEETSVPAPEIYDHYGDILLKNGKDSEAAEAWSKALGQEPDNREEIQKKLEDVAGSIVPAQTKQDKKEDE